MLRHAGLETNDGGGGLRPPEKAALPFDSRARSVARVAIALLVVLLVAWVARDFLVALTWAAVIAIAVWPIYIRCAISVLGGRSPVVAPLLFTFLTGLVLLVPIALALHQIAQGSDAFARSLNQLQQSGIPVPAWLAQLPIAGEYLDLWWRTNLGNPEVLVDWLRGVNTENITAWTGTLGGALLHRLVLFVFTLVALFLVLGDGAARCVGGAGCGGVDPARSWRRLVGGSRSCRLWRSDIADRRKSHSTGTDRRCGAATIPAGADRSYRRDAIVRIAWPVPRSRDHGGAADHLARMDRRRGLIGSCA
jgi:hypothetical protein